MTELGYWGIRGRAQWIRYLLAYTSTEYTEWNPADFGAWGAKKQELRDQGLYFPNLPFIRDEDALVAETPAVAIHIALRSNHPDLLGKGHDQVTVRAIQGVLDDLFTGFSKVAFGSQSTEAAQEGYTQALKAHQGKLQSLSDVLGTKTSFLGYVTFADFQFAHVAEFVRWIATELGHENPFSGGLHNLATAVHTTLSLPGVAGFEASAANKQRPWVFPHVKKW